MSEDPFASLLAKLEESGPWPMNYLFKFILKSGEKEKQKELRSFFKGNVSLALKESSGGKYLSVSVTAKMDSPQAVIEVYRKASEIEGLISI